MYFAAFILTWAASLASVFLSRRSSIPVLLRMILQPLQGFFNMLIFFYHKIQAIRKSKCDLTVLEAINILMTSPRDVPDAVANVDFVVMIQAVRNAAHDNESNPFPFFDNAGEEIEENNEIGDDSSDVGRNGFGVYRKNLPKGLDASVRGSVDDAWICIASNNSKSLGGFEEAGSSFSADPSSKKKIDTGASRHDGFVANVVGSHSTTFSSDEREALSSFAKSL